MSDLDLECAVCYILDLELNFVLLLKRMKCICLGSRVDCVCLGSGEVHAIELYLTVFVIDPK